MDFKVSVINYGLGLASGLLLWAIKDGLTYWLKRRGSFHFMIGAGGAPEYVTRAKFDVASQQMILVPPLFLEYRIPLVISNLSSVERQLAVVGVWFCEERPVIKRNGWHLPRTSLHPLGHKVEGPDGREVRQISIEPKGMISIVISGTNTDPTLGGRPFELWKYVMVHFILPGGRPHYLIKKVDELGGGRRCEPDVKPSFPLPEHYVRYQGEIKVTRTFTWAK